MARLHFSSRDGPRASRALLTPRPSRRRFLGAMAGALGAGLAFPGATRAGGPIVLPRPVPGGVRPLGPGTPIFHVFPPVPLAEPSTITDFNGVIGVTELQGTGTGANTKTGTSAQLSWDIHMVFMKGEYIGVDNHHHQGTFGFI